MPQEISVSYQAIKSKVYRLIDSLVVGEKSEAEVQESIRRWWALIHPADRPIAQKYLLMVLGRSASALDAMGDALLSVSTCELAAAADGRFPASGQAHARAGTHGQRKLGPNRGLGPRPGRRHRIYNSPVALRITSSVSSISALTNSICNTGGQE